ncbi:hypothetical protein KZC52_04665 [Microbacterium sp. kSW2-24]|uniref:lipopolysaccharide biosynthesis protein n=1 Tax=Microbacterium galbinum TaxID=2851646 RepID=UPI001FFD0999|nr:hypothetical protein [Microbacterium galbinum]MCK2022205.1 hypothetical protein [Microbacterium galbinum]
MSGPIRTAVGRLSGFTISVGIVTLIGIVSMPLLNLALGEATWGTLALVQTVSQFGGILVAFGWGATGAATVAGIPIGQRQAFYRTSLRARALLYVLVLPVIAVILTLLTRGDVLISVLGAAVYLLPHLGAIWYFTGEGKPMRLLLCDTLPTVAGGIAGVIGAVVTGELWVYLVAQGLGFIGAVVLDAVVVLRGSFGAAHTPVPLRTALSGQRHAVSATLVSGLYVTLPMVAVQAFLPALQPMYAVADRLFKYASIALLPIQQYFQSWVPDPEADFRHRARIATLAGVLVGVVGGACIALLSPWASTILSAGKISVPWQVSLPLGVAFVGIATAAIVGYACLVVVGRVRALAVSTLIGAIVGAPLILAFAAAGSVPLVAWAVAASELCVGGYQVLVLRRELRKPVTEVAS